MKIRTLWERAPYICGCKEPERASQALVDIFDGDVKRKKSKSAFDMSDIDREDPINRLYIVDVILTGFSGSSSGIDYVMNLSLLAALSTYKAQNKMGVSESQVKALFEEVEAAEKELNDGTVMTAKEASVLGWWNQ